jgi:excisionase family DNA binding protein
MPDPMFDYAYPQQQVLFDLPEVARFLGLSIAAVRAMVFRDKIRVVRHGRRVRVSLDEINRLLGR